MTCLLQISDDAALNLPLEDRIQWCKHCGAQALQPGASNNLMLDHMRRPSQRQTLLAGGQMPAHARRARASGNVAHLKVDCRVRRLRGT